LWALLKFKKKVCIKFKLGFKNPKALSTEVLPSDSWRLRWCWQVLALALAMALAQAQGAGTRRWHWRWRWRWRWRMALTLAGAGADNQRWHGPR
jgi:hypothetical protein